MRRVLKWLGIGAGVIVVLAVAAAAYVWIGSELILNKHRPVKPELLPKPSSTALAAAPHQMVVMGCVSCHGEGMRGNLMFEQAGVAKVYAPNVPLLIAKMSDQQIAQAMRQGVRPDGKAMWVMPSKVIQRLSPDETAAIIAYLRTLPRAGKQTPPIEILPMGRLGVVTHKFNPEPAHLPAYQASYPVDLGPNLAAGRKIAAVVCAECHGPALGGMVMEDGNRPPDLTVAGAYDLPAFTTLMHTGKPIGGRDLGLMTAIAKENLTHMTDAEIAALHAYLKARAEKATAG
jgi:mono/diheme cytochrome c family protein